MSNFSMEHKGKGNGNRNRDGDGDRDRDGDGTTILDCAKVCFLGTHYKICKSSNCSICINYLAIWKVHTNKCVHRNCKTDEMSAIFERSKDMLVSTNPYQLKPSALKTSHALNIGNALVNFERRQQGLSLIPDKLMNPVAVEKNSLRIMVNTENYDPTARVTMKVSPKEEQEKSRFVLTGGIRQANGNLSKNKEATGLTLQQPCEQFEMAVSEEEALTPLSPLTPTDQELVFVTKQTQYLHVTKKEKEGPKEREGPKEGTKRSSSSILVTAESNSAEKPKKAPKKTPTPTPTPTPKALHYGFQTEEKETSRVRSSYCSKGFYSNNIGRNCFSSPDSLNELDALVSLSSHSFDAFDYYMDTAVAKSWECNQDQDQDQDSSSSHSVSHSVSHSSSSSRQHIIDGSISGSGSIGGQVHAAVSDNDYQDDDQDQDDLFDWLQTTFDHGECSAGNNACHKADSYMPIDVEAYKKQLNVEHKELRTFALENGLLE